MADPMSYMGSQSGERPLCRSEAYALASAIHADVQRQLAHYGTPNLESSDGSKAWRGGKLRADFSIAEFFAKL